MNKFSVKKMLLAALFMPAAFIACKKMEDHAPDASNATAKPGIIEVSKAFPEIDLNLSVSFSTENDSLCKAKVGGDYIFVDQNVNFFKPDSTEYFTIRCQNKTNAKLQYLVVGMYHVNNQKLDIYYTKANTGN